MKKYKCILILAIATLYNINVQAQNEEVYAVTDDMPIVIQPLFEYPVAPDDIDGLQERCDWLVDHFWEPMNFKDKTTVDQNALNHAFGVYVEAMRYADGAKSSMSVDKLLSQIAKNPALSLQFAKAAEENLYGPRADVWNDGIFIKFLDNVIKNKGVKKERKTRYESLSKILSGTMQGTVPPEFDYTTPAGSISHYHPNGVITVIQFATSNCFDCMMTKLKLDTDIKFSTMVEKGKINVLYINTTPETGWQEEMKNYPSNWHVGASEKVADIYDLRLMPSIYVIDREGKVAIKNTNVETAMAIAVAAAEQ